MDEYSFNFDDWTAQFPLESAPSVIWQPSGMVAPSSIVYLEQIRKLAAAKFGDLGPAVPTDVFVFGEGQPPHRDMTLVGGVPYRPRDMPWPKSRSGDPMTFLAQFRFAESHDFMGSLPGDILLIVIEDDDPSEGNPPEKFAYEWHPLGLTDLISPSQAPQPYWEFFNGFGLRHRTVDYPDRRTEEVFEKIVPPEVIQDYRTDTVAAAIARIHGVKIGGAPWWPYPEYIFADRNNYEGAGQLLCSICAMYPELGEGPWINHPEPIEGSDWLRLDFADGFVINFFMDESFHITSLLSRICG